MKSVIAPRRRLLALLGLAASSAVAVPLTAGPVAAAGGPVVYYTGASKSFYDANGKFGLYSAPASNPASRTTLIAPTATQFVEAAKPSPDGTKLLVLIDGASDSHLDLYDTTGTAITFVRTLATESVSGTPS